MQREKAEKLDTVDRVRPISVVNEMRFMHLLAITLPRRPSLANRNHHDSIVVTECTSYFKQFLYFRD